MPTARIALYAQRAHHVEEIARIRIHVDGAVIRHEMLIVRTAVDHHVTRAWISPVCRRTSLISVHDVVAVVNHHVAIQRVEVAVLQAPALTIVDEFHRDALGGLRHDAGLRQLLAGIVGQIFDARPDAVGLRSIAEGVAAWLPSAPKAADATAETA